MARNSGRSHPQHPLYVPGLSTSTTSAPAGSTTPQPQNVLPTHLMGDAALFDDPMVIPGPPGAAGAPGTPGTIGVDGRAGPPGMDGEPADDWPTLIPGPAGPAGPSSVGPAGATGRPGVDGEDADIWPVMIPGTQGLQGPAGSTGPAGATGRPGVDGEDADTWPVLIPGPQGATGPAGGVGPAGPTGAVGPPGPEGDPFDDWPMMIPGSTGLQGPQGIPGVSGGGGGSSTVVVLPPFDSDADEDRAAFLRTPLNRITETSSGIIVSGGDITVLPQDTVNEGGQVSFTGAAAFGTWTLDNFQGRMRLFTGGVTYYDFNTTTFLIQPSRGLDLRHAGDSTNGIFTWAGANNYQIRTNDDGTAAQVDATKPSWAFAFGEGATDNFAIYRMAAGGGGGYINFWKVNNGGTWSPGADNAYDFGTTALRVRNGFVAGYVFEGINKSLAVSQATFVNVQTNITNLAFTAGTNEVWDVDVTLSVNMGTAATGVKFYFTGPASATGELHMEGNIASPTTWQSVYQAVITVPGTFFATGIITGQVRIKATLRTAGTGGTFQLVGITGGATTTCAVQKGSSLIAKRTT